MMEPRKVHWGGLGAVVVQDAAAERPSLVVTLCHGFGAPGSDLVALAGVLQQIEPTLAERVAFVFPAAPLALAQHGIGGGRAWWMIDLERLIYSPSVESLHQFRRECPVGLPDARQRLMALIEEASDHFGLGVERFVLGGFSQGSMIAVDVALRLPLAPAGLCIFSGGLINEREWAANAPRLKGLDVFQSHGRHDSILPLAMGRALCDFLNQAEAHVDFLEFSGDHEIPEAALQRTAALILRLAAQQS